MFAEALALPASDRSLLLQTQCGDDVELKEQVEALLASHASFHGFLEDGENSEFYESANALRESLPTDEMPGDRIDRYKLLVGA